MTATILLLLPGDMGAAVSAQLAAAGRRVLWVPEGRSEATRLRAHEAGLEPAASLARGLGVADVVLSICPPTAVETLAAEVAAAGFDGVYVEANAISPQKVGHIAALSGLSSVLDAAIIGPPPRTRPARLYLAGPDAHVSTVQDLFLARSVSEPLGNSVRQSAAVACRTHSERRPSDERAASLILRRWATG